MKNVNASETHIKFRTIITAQWMHHYVTLGPAVHHYVTLGRKVHEWRIGPESFGRVSPTTRHENHCFHAYVTLGNGC